MEDKAIKVFVLEVVCDSRGLYIDFSHPNSDKTVGIVLAQYGIGEATYKSLDKFFRQQYKDLNKLMKA
jgi:hypothetical protein